MIGRDASNGGISFSFIRSIRENEIVENEWTIQK